MSNTKMIAALCVSDEEKMLLSHTEDLMEQAENRYPVYSDFLDLGEQYLVRSFLSQSGLMEGKDYIFYGGYPYAERKILYFLPDYLVAAHAYEEDPQAGILSEIREFGIIRALSVNGSGYRILAHRDYLGAVLGLGIERKVIGDIAVTDDSHADILAEEKILPFLETLASVGADKVKTCILPDLESIPDTRKYETIHDTVASLRLDCILSAAINLPRDRAQQMIRSGAVRVDFRPEEDCSRNLCANCYLSIKGYGRYLFSGEDGISKKGRIRISIQKLL